MEAAVGAGLFLAGLGVGLAIAGGLGGGDVDDSGYLEAVKEECAVGSSDIRIGDGGDTMSIDRAGAEVSPGATMLQLGCILEELDVPDSIIDHINSTRALDGYQEDNFDQYELGWTYHPDDGVNMTITLTE